MDDIKVPDFSDAIAELAGRDTKRKLPRVTPRVQAGTPAIVEIMGQLFQVCLVDISPGVVRIDQKIPIGLKGRCSFTIKTKPAIQLICEPIVDQREFDDGFWCRLQIISRVKFDQVTNIIQQSA